MGLVKKLVTRGASLASGVALAAILSGCESISYNSNWRNNPKDVGNVLLAPLDPILRSPHITPVSSVDTSSPQPVQYFTSNQNVDCEAPGILPHLKAGDIRLTFQNELPGITRNNYGVFIARNANTKESKDFTDVSDWNGYTNRFCAGKPVVVLGNLNQRRGLLRVDLVKFENGKVEQITGGEQQNADGLNVFLYDAFPGDYMAIWSSRAGNVSRFVPQGNVRFKIE